MLKKALIASAVLAASAGVAFANGGRYVAPAPAASTSNIYVGVGVSRDFVNYRLNVAGSKVDFGKDGWNGDLFAGIGWTFQDHYYLGGEVFGSLSGAKAQLGDGANLALKHSYGLSVIPGVKLSPSTMLYGRVGWVRSKFKASDAGFSSSKSKNGLQLGLGFETMVTNNVSTRLEYDWSRYNKFNRSVDGVSASLKPTVNQAKLQVAYHFMSA